MVSVQSNIFVTWFLMIGLCSIVFITFERCRRLWPLPVESYVCVVSLFIRRHKSFSILPMVLYVYLFIEWISLEIVDPYQFYSLFSLLDEQTERFVDQTGQPNDFIDFHIFGDFRDLEIKLYDCISQSAQVWLAFCRKTTINMSSNHCMRCPWFSIVFVHEQQVPFEFATIVKFPILVI